MGRSGEGRILFDGTSGSIQSGNYMPGTSEEAGSGMRIDLTEGHIDAYDFKLTSKSITLDSSPEIIDEAIKVLDSVCAKEDFELRYEDQNENKK